MNTQKPTLIIHFVLLVTFLCFPELKTLEQRIENVETQSQFQILRLEFGVSNGASRSFVLGFSEDATDGFDYGLDGGLITTPPADDMGSLLNGQQYVIQAFAPITHDKEVDLILHASGNFTYTLKSTEITNIPADQELYLRDKLTNTYYNLRSEQPYNFTSDAGLFNDRFDVVFQTEADALDVDEFDTNTIQIYVNNPENKLYIKGLADTAKQLHITNMLGQSIAAYNNIDTQTLENGISVSNLSSGVYMVTVNTDQNQTTSKKVIIE